MRETGNGGDARGGFGVEGRLLRSGGGVSSTAAVSPSRRRRCLLHGSGGDWIGYGFERVLVDLRMEVELGKKRCAGPICDVAVAHVGEMRYG
jgi:hypothetical protein